jgi:hypothetical protein
MYTILIEWTMVIFIIFLKRQSKDRREDIVLEEAHSLLINVISLKVVHSEKQGVQRYSDC